MISSARRLITLPATASARDLPSCCRAWAACVQQDLFAPTGTTDFGSQISQLSKPHLTVEENLLLGAAPGGKGHWTLETVYALFPILRERRERMGTALSGGQQQMVAVGRAMLGNPHVLPLDEPSENLSPILIDDLVTIFNKIRDAGTGIVVVERHLTLARRVTQRFVVMAKGESIDRGRSEDIDSAQHRAALAL